MDSASERLAFCQCQATSIDEAGFSAAATPVKCLAEVISSRQGCRRRRATRIVEDLAISPMQVEGSHEVALALFQQCAGVVERPATYRFCGPNAKSKSVSGLFLVPAVYKALRSTSIPSCTEKQRPQAGPVRKHMPDGP